MYAVNVLKVVGLTFFLKKNIKLEKSFENLGNLRPFHVKPLAIILILQESTSFPCMASFLHSSTKLGCIRQKSSVECRRCLWPFIKFYFIIFGLQIRNQQDWAPFSLLLNILVKLLPTFSGF